MSTLCFQRQGPYKGLDKKIRYLQEKLLAAGE